MAQTDLKIRGASPQQMLKALDERVALLMQKRDEIDDELRTLRQARPALAKAAKGTKRPARRAVRVTPPRTAERQAGPGNVAKVAATLRELGGRATQAILTERTWLNSGTMTYALRALEEKGIVKPTGESVRRSAEFALVGDGVYVMPPGSAS